MLHAFESYCTRQGTASLLLQNLEKEKELLRIFLKVSQMENTVLRRMNLNSFLMVSLSRCKFSNESAAYTHTLLYLHTHDASSTNCPCCVFQSQFIIFMTIYSYIFLQVPVQRVTKYPLLLARLLKATPSARPDIQEVRKRLKQAQTNIELHLEHMNAVSYLIILVCIS